MKKKMRIAKAGCGILLGFFALVFYAHLGMHILEFRRAASSAVSAVSGAVDIAKPATIAKENPCSYCQTARISPFFASLAEGLPGVSNKAGLTRRDHAVSRLPGFGQSLPRPPPFPG